jgi:hypothetical protein
VQATCQSALEPVLPELRKLRLLGRSEDIPQSRVIAKTRKYMLAIGDTIAALATTNTGDMPDVVELWEFVSEFTENTCSGDKLAELFAKLDSKRATSSAAADGTATASALAGDAARLRDSASEVPCDAPAGDSGNSRDADGAAPCMEAAAALTTGAADPAGIAREAGGIGDEDGAALLAAVRGPPSVAASDDAYDPDEVFDEVDGAGDEDDGSDWQAD